MGKGNVAKKRGDSGKGKTVDNADKDTLKELLSATGPFILRDYCRLYGIDPDDAKTSPKTKLVSFLMGKFKDGELTLNDLYPNKGKKGGAKPPKSKKPDDDGDDGADSAGDDDLDNDDLDLELEGEGYGDDIDLDDGDLDLEDETNDELDDVKARDDTPDISVLEDKVDKLIDLNSNVAKSLDLLVQLQLELIETLRQGLKVLFKLGKIKDPGKLLKQIEKKAREFAGISNDGDDDLEDE